MVYALSANNYYKNLWIKLFQLFKFVSKNNSVIIRLTYIGATLGATTGVGTGVGKHLCNLLIIKLGVRGVTKQQSCVYTRTCVREYTFTLQRYEIISDIPAKDDFFYSLSPYGCDSRRKRTGGGFRASRQDGAYRWRGERCR